MTFLASPLLAYYLPLVHGARPSRARRFSGRGVFLQGTAATSGGAIFPVDGATAKKEKHRSWATYCISLSHGNRKMPFRYAGVFCPLIVLVVKIDRRVFRKRELISHTQ